MGIIRKDKLKGKLAKAFDGIVDPDKTLYLHSSYPFEHPDGVDLIEWYMDEKRAMEERRCQSARWRDRIEAFYKTRNTGQSATSSAVAWAETAKEELPYPEPVEASQIADYLRRGFKARFPELDHIDAVTFRSLIIQEYERLQGPKIEMTVNVSREKGD
jgi:hypothetical protein